MNTPRDSGCTLTGALSVTTEIDGSVTIVHGPGGVHTITSLFSIPSAPAGTTRGYRASSRQTLPKKTSSSAGKTPSMQPYEKLSKKTRQSSASFRHALREPSGTMSTRSAGATMVFRSFQSRQPGSWAAVSGDGHVQALISLSSLAECGEKTLSVNLVGEKTLEFERDEHFNEVRRLLSEIGIPICARFICRSSMGDISRLSRGHATYCGTLRCAK